MQDSYKASEQASRAQSLYTAISALTLVLILVAEPIYSQSLFDSSLTFIADLQSTISDPGFEIWRLYSDSIALIIAAPILISMLKFRERARAFYYTLMLTSMLFVMNVGKLTYHQARPFWVSADIKAGSCSTQFGNPSGHSLFSMGAAVFTWLDYNALARVHADDGTLWTKWYTRAALLLVAVTYGLTIGYSRVVLGAHSWN